MYVLYIFMYAHAKLLYPSYQVLIIAYSLSASASDIDIHYATDCISYGSRCSVSAPPQDPSMTSISRCAVIR